MPAWRSTGSLTDSTRSAPRGPGGHRRGRAPSFRPGRGADTHQGERARQLPGLHEIVEGREPLAAGEVAGRVEAHHGARRSERAADCRLEGGQQTGARAPAEICQPAHPSLITLRRAAVALGTWILRNPCSRLAWILSVSISPGNSITRDIGVGDCCRWRYRRLDSPSAWWGWVATVRSVGFASMTISS